MRRTMSSFSPLLPFFVLLAVVSLLIGVNAEPESSMDYTSAFVEQRKTEAVSTTNVSLKSVTESEVNDDNEKDDEGEGDDDGDDGDAEEEEEEEEEEDSSGDGGGAEEDEEEVEEEETEGEYEGEERDEYEDELKALVESHEAMSKDKTKEEGGKSSKARSSSPRSQSDAKNFESQENVLEKQSDENVESNEAIIDELPNKHEDKEVADLLKYKKEKNSRKMEEADLGKKKKKRVPTVKKELSTQKEIILVGNETQVPKGLVPSEESFDVLNEVTEPVQRRNLEGNERSQQRQTQEKISESPFEDQKVLDKRHKTLPRNLKTCSTKECEIEREEERKMIALRDQEENEVKSSSKLWKRFGIEGLERWEGPHSRFPTDLNTGLEEQRGYDGSSTGQVSVDDSQKEGKKQKKKKKKKKKKKTKARPQHRRSTTTTELPIPSSTTARTTTETEMETTTAAIQWHLLAEKWFGPSWQQDVRPESEDVAKIRYTPTSKPRTIQTSSIRGIVDRQGTPNDETEPDTEGSPSLLQKARNLDGRSNLFRFREPPIGKINSHRNVYDLEADRLRVDERPERVFQRLRFGEMGATSPRDFGLREKNQDDYRDDDGGGPLEEEFAHNREYRPPNQDYAMSRNWPDVARKYNRPWKGDGRSMPSRLSNEWAWRQPPLRYDVDFWPARGKTWQPYGDYWTPHVDTEVVDDSEIDRDWRARESQERWQRPRSQIRQRQRQRQRQRLRQRLRQENDEGEQRLPYSPWELEGADVWPMSAKPFQLEPPWPRIKDHLYESTKPVTAPATTTTTTTTRLNGKDKISLPKISMTTWNSLTSDPATWPYKSSGTKPWPKDENGKSYNPNADLVRKLGLDNSDDAIWSKGKTEKIYDVRDITFDRRGFLETSAKNSSKQEDEVQVKKYKIPNRTLPEFNIFDMRPRVAKDWTKLRNGESAPPPPPLLDSTNQDVNGWYRDDEEPRKVLPNGLPPELRSVSGWNMPADKSTWMPYRYEPLNAYENINEIDSWPRRGTNVDVWDRKDLADPWPGRFQNDRWNTENYPLWDRKRSFDRGQPEDVDAVKTNRIPFSSESDSSKTNESNVVAVENSKENLSSTKSNNWNTSDEKSGSWSSRWKQFSYHRVTSLPTSKPGTISNSNSKSRNAFVAVSVLSTPKYSPSRNDIEDSQNNRNDPFERQLEDLRRQRFWGSKANVIEDTIRSTSPTIESTTAESTLPTAVTNSTLVVHRPEEEYPRSANKEYEMHLRI